MALVFFARFGQAGELLEVGGEGDFGDATQGKESTHTVLATVGWLL
jgi:hypothetical protein